MLLDVISIHWTVSPTHRSRRFARLRCDQCLVVFERPARYATHDIHLCSRGCLDAAHGKDGALSQKLTATVRARFGVDNPSQSIQIKNKRRDTWKRKYGVDHAFQAPSVKAKIVATMIKNHGVAAPMQSPKIRQRSVDTCMKRYGVKHVSQDPEISARAARSLWSTQVIKHWKSDEELTCRASYEVAFVNWCNANRIDFDWQIPFKMPDGRFYFIDAYIKDGAHADTWVEIKGWLDANHGRNRAKWEWFHSEHPSNSQLWDKKRLQDLEILP